MRIYRGRNRPRTYVKVSRKRKRGKASQSPEITYIYHLFLLYLQQKFKLDLSETSIYDPEMTGEARKFIPWRPLGTLGTANSSSSLFYQKKLFMYIKIKLK